jgi:phosphoglycolate phosphatase
VALRLVIFDCDGTLVDSQHAIVSAMTAAFGAEGLAAIPAARVRRVVGLPLVEAIAELAPDLSSDSHERIAEAYKDAHIAARGTGAGIEPLFDGIADALVRLEGAGFLLGVATGKGSRGLRHTLDLHGLAGRFATLQTADLCPGKPRPDMVLRALAETGVAAADAGEGEGGGEGEGEDEGKFDEVAGAPGRAARSCHSEIARSDERSAPARAKTAAAPLPPSSPSAQLRASRVRTASCTCGLASACACAEAAATAGGLADGPPPAVPCRPFLWAVAWWPRVPGGWEGPPAPAAAPARGAPPAPPG